MLVDEVEITVKAGNGGDGKVNFHREKFVPKGGPDGGDGGIGGDIYFTGVSDISALKRFRYQKKFEAESGKPGGANRRSGLSGNDLEIKLPIGTVITDKENGESWEINKVEEKVLIAKGGKGGKGNWHYRSAINQTPMEFQEGEEGVKRYLYLELRLIADIGLIGLPSAGKSSILNELTKANVKTAAYHFTTLEPNLGAMDGIIIADLPGLIAGAHEGKGLGVKFLKHIKRTKVLVHCLSTESTDPVKDYQTIRTELGDYDRELLEKPEIVLITKTDLVKSEQLKKMKTLLNRFQIPPSLQATEGHSKSGMTEKTEILDVSIYDFDSIERLKDKFRKFGE